MFILCRDVYHCTPSQLAKEPLDMIMLHLEFLRVEQQVRKFSDAKSTRRGGS